MKFFACLSLLTIPILFCCASQIMAQEKETRQLSIEVPISIRSQLACFELGKKELESSLDSAYMAMYIQNLTHPQETSFIPGLYTYQILGPHFSRKLFIYYNNKVQPFKSVYINDVLKEFLIYSIALNLPVKTRIDYLKSICDYLNDEYLKP